MQQFLGRHHDKKGATMLELMAMMAIMGLGIVAMLGVVGSGAEFAKNTEDNIKAINLAREGIEGVIDWRNTNWLRFSSDRTNCWKNLNYNSNCIGGGSTDIADGSYILTTQNGLWYLSGATAVDPLLNWNSYKQSFQVGLDNDGFFTQTGITTSATCSTSLQSNCLTIFTREITINTPGGNTGTLNISSIVRWKSKRDHEVKLDTTLTNWKSKF